LRRPLPYSSGSSAEIWILPRPRGSSLLSPRGPFNSAEYLVLAAYMVGMRILFFTVVNVGGWY
jgi:hypothetical protein